MISSERILTWLAVFLTMSVAIVTVNLLSIILFMTKKKNRSLRTRAMYLVINLIIVDMFVGGFSHFSLFVTSLSVMRHCAISALNPGTAINNWLSFRLVSSDLSYKYCSNFIRSDACTHLSLL